MKASILIVVLCWITISCNRSFNGLEELTSYVNDQANGLLVSTQKGPYYFQANYKPSAMLFEEAANYKVLGLNKIMYFNLSMSMNKRDLVVMSRDPIQRSQLINKLAFEMQEHVFIRLENGKKIELLDYNFDRSFGLSPATNLLLIFERNEVVKQASFNLVITEFGLRTGPVNLEFETKDITTIPSII